MGTYGKRLRALRTARGLGLNAFAETADISRGYLSRIERDMDDPPGKEVAERIAQRLGLTADEATELRALWMGTRCPHCGAVKQDARRGAMNVGRLP